MKLQALLLTYHSKDALKALCQEHGVQADRRSVDAMRSALSACTELPLQRLIDGVTV